MHFLNVLLILGIILISITFIHFVYMKATSYICITKYPPKPFIDENGEEYYVGAINNTITTKCKGGILAKFPIN